MKKIVSLSMLLLVANAARASQPQQDVKVQQEGQLNRELNSLAYQAKSQQVISATLGLNQGLPNDYKKFLDEMSTNGSKLKSGTLDISKAFKKLDPNFVGLFVMHHINRDKGARFYWEFVQASSELMAHRLRRTLRCYTTLLEPFELPYASEMQKVTEEEHAKKIDSIDSSVFEKMVIEEAAVLAETIAIDLNSLKAAPAPASNK